MKAFPYTTPLLDLAEGLHRKEAGMNIAAENNATILVEAKNVARDLGRRNRKRAISADNVMEVMVSRGYGQKCLGNAAGSLFSGRDWQWSGDRIKSKRPHAHANELKTWYYLGR